MTRKQTVPAPVPEMTEAQKHTALAAERDRLRRAWALRSSTPGERRRMAEIERAIGGLAGGGISP